jgi:serine protease AprX
MRQFPDQHGLRGSALWGKKTKGEARSSALWGKGGRKPAALLAVLVAFAVPATAHAQAVVPSKLRASARAYPSRSFDVIVLGTDGVDARALKQRLTTPNGKALGDLKHSYAVVEGVALRLTGAQLLSLAKKPGIGSISLDAPTIAAAKGGKNAGGNGVPAYLTWLYAVGSDQLWKSGVETPTIAIVDSGVDANAMTKFGWKLKTQVNLSSLSPGADGDGYGHGTFVAAIAASATAAPFSTPTANIVSLRVMDDQGKALTSDVIAAADWIYRHRDEYGIRVANFSLHSAAPAYSLQDPLNLAVERLWLTGTVVVTAAGNEGAGRMLYAPASDPFVITVGATDVVQTVTTEDDVNTPWSSYGYTAEGFAKPEVGAPGRYMIAPVPHNSMLIDLFPTHVLSTSTSASDPVYMWMSGSSFAAPVVSAAAAHILARHPDWTPGQVKGAMMLTARGLPLATPQSLGVGEVNSAAAAALPSAPDANAALQPFVTSDPVSGAPVFDAASWARTAQADASWASASWASASWSSASWSDASWASASWSSASWSDASWASASWSSASWSDALWASASWANFALE